MTRLLIPDAGPLFSLAAGNLLGLLSHFRLGITDVVKEETIDRGLGPKASSEAQRLLSFYNANAAEIEIFQTQVGRDIRALRATTPNYQAPRNVGELSIQSLLIDLQLQGVRPPPVILFEDGWFLRNAQALAKPCIAISTQAFLVNAERMKLIKSAAKARDAIAACRPDAYDDIKSIDMAPPP